MLDEPLSDTALASLRNAEKSKAPVSPMKSHRILTNDTGMSLLTYIDCPNFILSAPSNQVKNGRAPAMPVIRLAGCARIG